MESFMAVLMNQLLAGELIYQRIMAFCYRQ